MVTVTHRLSLYVHIVCTIHIHTASGEGLAHFLIPTNTQHVSIASNLVPRHPHSHSRMAPDPATAPALSTPLSTSQPDLIESTAGASQPPPVVDIKDLLRRLWPQAGPGAVHDNVTPDEISEAIAHFFTDRIDDVQTGALLMCLHFTGLDRDPTVLSQCAQKMLKAAAQVDAALLREVVRTRGRKDGGYGGGFVCGIPPIYLLDRLLF